MDQSGGLNNQLQQAYLSEYKGYLFEYLVALELAQRLGLRSSFMDSLGEKQWIVLAHYEKEIRKLKPSLLTTLPSLAKRAAKAYLKTLHSNAEITGIWLQGKIWAKGMGEGDIAICVDGRDRFLSLKLCKVGSFINTKSAGIKSFIQGYFSPFHSEWQQRQLNDLLGDSHLVMLEELYRKENLSFHGQWDGQWEEQGLSECPGALPRHLKPIIHNHYHRVAVKLDKLLQNFCQRDGETFKTCILPLMGFSEELSQVVVYHRRDQFHSLNLLERSGIKQLLNIIKCGKSKRVGSTLSINLHQYYLQLRLKPASKFTTPSLKVNCAIKQLAY